MIIFEARDTSCFTIGVILAIQYALAQCSAIFGHACIKIIIIFIILKNDDLQEVLLIILNLLNLRYKNKLDCHTHHNQQCNQYDMDMLKESLMNSFTHGA